MYKFTNLQHIFICKNNLTSGYLTSTIKYHRKTRDTKIGETKNKINK